VHAALGTAALAAGGIGAYAQPASRPPNIIFIVADDLGYADVSCYGRRDFTTPNIDRIAARGMRFLQGYANSAVCSASRLALITGRYQYRLRLGLEEPLVGNPEVGLPPEHPTLPSLLKKEGYGTTLIGKWHLGALPKFGPLKSGYDHFFGFRGEAVDYFSHITSRQQHDLWDQDVEAHQVGYLTDQLGARPYRRNMRARYARPNARFPETSNRSPPPTSIAAAEVTCIGPWGPFGSMRHILRSVPWLDSAPSTAKATRSRSAIDAGPNRSKSGGCDPEPRRMLTGRSRGSAKLTTCRFMPPVRGG
jgi:Sulfatase